MKKNTKSAKRDWAKEISEKIIAKLEGGHIPWIKPWEHWVSWRRCGDDYQGANQLFLSGGEYITFKQCKEEGGKINKGAKAETIVFYKHYKKKVKDENGNEVLDDEGNPLMKDAKAIRGFSVFKVSDTTLEPNTSKKKTVHRWKPENKAEQLAKAYSKKYGVAITHGSNRAFQNDFTGVTIPEKEQFKSTAAYYNTLFHELVHSTHKETGRDVSQYSKNKKARAREELVAEIGAAYILSYLGIESESNFDNTVAYVQSWAQNLKDDKAAITYATPKAIEAANLILGIQ